MVSNLVIWRCARIATTAERVDHNLHSKYVPHCSYFCGWIAVFVCNLFVHRQWYVYHVTSWKVTCQLEIPNLGNRAKENQIRSTYPQWSFSDIKPGLFQLLFNTVYNLVTLVATKFLHCIICRIVYRPLLGSCNIGTEIVNLMCATGLRYTKIMFTFSLLSLLSNQGLSCGENFWDS